MFILIAIFVLALMYGYIGWRIIVPADFGLPTTIILWGIVAVFWALPIVTAAFRFSGTSNGLIDVLAWIGYLGFGFFTLLFAILVVKDVILLVSTGVHRLLQVAGNLFGTPTGTADTVDPERRRVLVNSVNLGILGLTGALTGYGIYGALRDPKIVRVDVPLRNLPSDLDGFTIVQITDIHVSGTIKRPFVQEVVDTVNALQPDLVALTGDLVDGSVAQLGVDVAPLADLKAPYGSYFVTGNHEYYSGVEPWIEEVSRLGFTVLVNEHRIIDRGEGKLLLAGVTDFEGGRFGKRHVSDPHQAIANAPDCHARILLAHQPKSIFEASRAGFDYMISGHTHGGQYFPYHFLAALTQPYLSGFHTHDGTHVYVSRGTGYWGPQIRLGARSEITVHRLIQG
ncbi:MAG: metallophosphoesterase [candidate division Zixibacteria bacterium]|nr:metallophosphoesterase [candidate division Zixibacteria bacterium]